VIFSGSERVVGFVEILLPDSGRIGTRKLTNLRINDNIISMIHEYVVTTAYIIRQEARSRQKARLE